MIRLATAHAKARLSNEVREQDAVAAEEILRYALFKEVVKTQRRKKRRLNNGRLEEDSDEEDDEGADEHAGEEGEGEDEIEAGGVTASQVDRAWEKAKRLEQRSQRSRTKERESASPAAGAAGQSAEGEHAPEVDMDEAAVEAAMTQEEPSATDISEER